MIKNLNCKTVYKHVLEEKMLDIYELNFGKNKDVVKAITVDGKTYDLSTAEKLYDYILDSNKEKTLNENYFKRFT